MKYHRGALAYPALPPQVKQNPTREASGRAEIRALAACRDYRPPLYSGFGEAEGEVFFAGFSLG